MINQVVLTGRLVSDPDIIVTENNKKKTVVTVAIPRTYKNMEGIYESDFVRCVLWNGIAESTCEYCKKGDIVGVRGRLQTSRYEADNNVRYSMDVIAEKVSFISNKRNNHEE